MPMAKYCFQCGKEITEWVDGSQEIRRFYRNGKICVYFDTDLCMDEGLKSFLRLVKIVRRLSELGPYARSEFLERVEKVVVIRPRE